MLFSKKKILNLILKNSNLLEAVNRGIEKECLRISKKYKLSNKNHPKLLGSALMHKNITTDYSESLIEFFTDIHSNIDSMIKEMQEIHYFILNKIENEIIWNYSIPMDIFFKDKIIPISKYGKSNIGKFRRIYRKGLCKRYGKTMQCISGIHYNFSLPDIYWSKFKYSKKNIKQVKSEGYICLIKNFIKYSWLLLYLFGASPIISNNFVKKKSFFKSLNYNLYYMEHATSLRMSDLGYKNNTNNKLKFQYDNFIGFLNNLFYAISEPSFSNRYLENYLNDKIFQLNNNILQIENEFYSLIRPKFRIKNSERPILSLYKNGIQYVEIRCIDLNPFEPIGISLETSKFIESFLLFCASNINTLFDKNIFIESNRNFLNTAIQGRKPEFKIYNNGNITTIQNFGNLLIENIYPYAYAFDQSYGGSDYVKSLMIQKDKLKNPKLTPSYRLLSNIKKNNFKSLNSFRNYKFRKLKKNFLRSNLVKTLNKQVLNSIISQKVNENNDNMKLSEYISKYNLMINNK